MEAVFTARKKYLWLPVAAKKEKFLLEIAAGGRQQCFWVPLETEPDGIGDKSRECRERPDTEKEKLSAGAAPEMETGAAPGMEAGAALGREVGAAPGTETGAAPGREAGAALGREVGAAPGIGTRGAPGMQAGAGRTETAGYRFDYYAPFDISGFPEGEVSLRGNFTEAFAASVCFADALPWERKGSPEVGPVREKRKQECGTDSQVHFHAHTGWINDPNGLVYRNGVYHLYFQYNPMDTEWDNMSWGHAVSRDLLHWEQLPDVMYPDENGMIFSGCGMRNDRGELGLPRDALLFFYTAAGNKAPWGMGKRFIQKLAYSLDGGYTLVKAETALLDTVCEENRDPKVFWYEPGGHYVMVLWLEGNDFGIFISPDLKEFTLTDRIVLDKAWECPDLLELRVENSGESKWIFWSADGYYFTGDFDGQVFRPDSGRREAFCTKLPYAAQTFSGVEGRCISVSWLRTENRGKNYRGMMGLPRELSLRRTPGGLCLAQRFVRELAESRREIFSGAAPAEVVFPAAAGPRRSDKMDAAEAPAPVAMAAAEGMPGAVAMAAAAEAPGAAEMAAAEGMPAPAVITAAVEVVCELSSGAELAIDAFGLLIRYLREEGLLTVGEETVSCPAGLSSLDAVFDGEVIEIMGDSGIMNGIFERKTPAVSGKIAVRTDGEAQVRVYRI